MNRFDPDARPVSCNELLTQEEVASLTKLPATTLRTWRSRRKGPPYVKLGGAVRYFAKDVQAWMEGARIEPQGEVQELALPVRSRWADVDRRHRTRGYKTKSKGS